MQGQVKRAYEDALARADDRPAHEPPVPRRARDRQARAQRDAHRRAAPERLLGRGRARGRAAARPGAARGADPRRRRDERAGGESARRPWRRGDLRRQPPPRARGRRSRSATAARRCRSTSCRRSCERADALVCATSSPHALLGAEELAAVMEARDGRPLLIIDLAVPRDVAADVRDVPGVALVRRRRPAGGRAAQQSGAPGRGVARRGDRRGGDPALRRVARLAGGAADAERAARARQRRSRSRSCARTPAAGSRPPSATASASRRSRRRSSTACCTSRRCA